MTHEELLLKIAFSGDTSLETALRAVVELHKPKNIPWTNEILTETYCDGCHQEYYVKYPCPTIQAIEKEF
jgi:hypothetical protein